MNRALEQILLILLLLLINSFSPAQEIDSLKSGLDITKLDSATIEKLYSINDHYRINSAYDSQLVYGTHQIKIGKELDHIEAISWGYYDRASAYWNLGRYDDALSDTDSAKVYFLSAHDTTRVYNSTYLAGMILGDQGKYTEAMKAYYEAILGFEALQKPLNKGAVLNSVALVHQWMGNLDKAEEEFLRSIEILESAGNKERLAMSMSNLAYLYSMNERYDESMAMHRSALALHEEIGSEWGIASNNGNIGDLLTKMGHATEAIPYLQKNVNFQREKGDPKELASTLMMLADAHKANGNHENARALYEEALQLSAESRTLDYEKQSHESLSQLAVVQGDFQEAFLHLKEANLLRDSLFDREKIAAISEISTKYETEKKEAEISLLTTENALKDAALENENNVRKGLIGGLILLLTIGGLIAQGQRKKMKTQRLIADREKVLRETQFEKDLQEIELKALRAQMNPHFIFNSMNSINRLILEDRNAEASRNLTKFSKLVRMILEFSERKTVSLSEELEFLETYIQIESNRFKGKINYLIDIENGLAPEELTIPSMILQPFVENAIWHGLMHKEGDDGLIELTFKEREGFLECTIEDNGVGRKRAGELKESNAVHHQSMGMKITQARLQSLERSGTHGSMTIVDLDRGGECIGTRVEIRIPI